MTSSRPTSSLWSSSPQCADPPRNCSVARRISALVFHVLDERAQFGQDLTSPWIVQKDPWRGGGEGRQERVQSAVSNWGFRERAGHLRKSQTLDRRSKECGVVMRDQRSRNDCLDSLVAVDKGPGGDRPVRAAHAQAGVITQIVDALRPLSPA